MSLLVVKGLTKRFGGLLAVDDVSFAVAPGRIKGFIGPNGAGKTTTFNVITGYYRPDQGEVWFKDQRIDGLPPHAIARLGLVRTFQRVRLFPGMNVLEHVMVGRHPRTSAGFLAALVRGRGVRAEEQRTLERARELLGFVGLAERADADALGLPYGQQRLLEIARALATEPALLLLDEPAAGLNAAEQEALGRVLADLKAQGMAIVLVEHHVKLVMSVCDDVVVLSFGRKLAEGTPREVQANPDVAAAYLGAPARA